MSIVLMSFTVTTVAFLGLLQSVEPAPPINYFLKNNNKCKLLVGDVKDERGISYAAKASEIEKWEIEKWEMGNRE